MFQLVYLSTATVPFSRDELAALLEKSRTNNRPRGITGMLLHHTGRFLQVLEGEEAAVRELARKIAQDARHGSFSVLHEEHTEGRLFPDWSMGFHEVDGSEPLEGFNRLMNSELTMAQLGPNPPRAKLLVMSFKMMRAPERAASSAAR